MANDLVLNPTAIVNKMIALRVKPGVLKADSPKPVTDVRIESSNLSKEVNKFRACDGYACFYCREWSQIIHKKHFTVGNKTRKKLADVSVDSAPREKVKEFIQHFEKKLQARLDNDKESDGILLYISDTIQEYLSRKSTSSTSLDAIFAPITHDASPEAIAFTKDPQDTSQLIPQVEIEKTQLSLPASDFPLLRNITPKILANHDSPSCNHSPADNTPSDLETLQKILNSAIAKEAKTCGLSISQALNSVWDGTRSFLEEIKKIENVRSDIAGEGCFQKVSLFNQKNQELLQSFNDYWSPVAETHKKTKGKKNDKPSTATAEDIDDAFFKFLDNVRSGFELWKEEFLNAQVNLCQQLIQDIFQACTSVVNLARVHYRNNGSDKFQVELENKSEKVLQLLQGLSKQMETKLAELEAEFVVKSKEIYSELDGIKDAWSNESQSTLHGRLEKAANKDFKKKIKKLENMIQTARIWCVTQLKTFLPSHELAQILAPCLGVQMLHAEDIEPTKLKELIEQHQEIVDSIIARKQDINEQYVSGVNIGRSTLGAVLGKLFLKEGLRLIEERVSVHKEKMLLGVYNDTDSIDSSDIDYESKSKASKKKNKKKKKNANDDTSVASSTASSPVEEKSIKLPEVSNVTLTATKSQTKSQILKDKSPTLQTAPAKSVSEVKSESLNKPQAAVQKPQRQTQIKREQPPVPSPTPKVSTVQPPPGLSFAHIASQHSETEKVEAKSKPSVKENGVPTTTTEKPIVSTEPPLKTTTKSNRASKSDVSHVSESHIPSSTPKVSTPPGLSFARVASQHSETEKVEVKSKPSKNENALPTSTSAPEHKPTPRATTTKQPNVTVETSQKVVSKSSGGASKPEKPHVPSSTTQPPPGLSFARVASQHSEAEKVEVKSKSSKNEKGLSTSINAPENKPISNATTKESPIASTETLQKATAEPNSTSEAVKTPLQQSKPLSFADTVNLPPPEVADRAPKSADSSPPAPNPQLYVAPSVSKQAAGKMNPPPGMHKSNSPQDQKPQPQARKEHPPKPSDTASSWRRADAQPNEIRTQASNGHLGPAPGLDPIPHAYGIATPPESVAGVMHPAFAAETPAAIATNSTVPPHIPITPNVSNNMNAHPPGFVETDLRDMGHEDMLKFVHTLLTEKSELVSLLMNMQKEVYSLTVKCTDMVEYVRRQDMMYHVKEQEYKQALMMKEMDMEKARRYVHAMEQRIALLERSMVSAPGSTSRPGTPSTVQEPQSPMTAPKASTPMSRTSSLKAETQEPQA
ncbi:hypothetical protein K7432_003653 [Basidiobolus ranarum]|uniref:Uncharacterized protein n=1 Tax=Basidiobolus ranarum TaxID=34480 RepID=A0ABR2WZD5_9FUNG